MFYALNKFSIAQFDCFVGVNHNARPNKSENVFQAAISLSNALSFIHWFALSKRNDLESMTACD